MSVDLSTFVEKLAEEVKRLPGSRSLSEGITLSDVSSKQMNLGEGVEKEHTNDEAVARGIALDHLIELPDYYSRLKKMEEEGKRSLGEEAAVKAAFTP